MKLHELIVFESRIREAINAEYTLSAKTEKENLLIGDILEVGNEAFRIVEMRLSGCGQNLLEMQAEHISYDLNVDMQMLPDVIEMDPETQQQIMKPNPNSIDGEYSSLQAINLILEGTGFVAGEVMPAEAKRFRLGKVTRREALFKVAQFFDAELVFSGHAVSLMAKRGADRGARFAYGENLKSIERFETKDGVGYRVEAVETGKAFELGDMVEIFDETSGISTKQRILVMEYDPLRRVVTSMEIGQRQETFADLYEEDVKEVDRKIQEAIEGLELPESTEERIVEVTKETVLAVETIHATTAWIEELEVNYLRTNFEDRMRNAGNVWNYIYAHGMEIEFNTALLHETELEQYRTVSGRALYWTSIGEHPDAKKYFTLQKPQIKEGATIIVDGEERPLLESDFYVMVPKIVSQATKLRIVFEKIQGTDALFPVMIWGQGDGSENGQKCTMYKDTNGFVLKYFKTNSETAEISLSSAGVAVKNDNAGNGGQLRNIHISTAAPTENDIADGELWVVI